MWKPSHQLLSPLIVPGAISIARDHVKHELTKHIGVDASYMRSQVHDQIVALQYVPSSFSLWTSS